MKLIKSSTRWVFITSTYVYKIPSLYSWKNFLYGLLANIQEYTFSKICSPYVAPVLFKIPGGFLNIYPYVYIFETDIAQNMWNDQLQYIDEDTKMMLNNIVEQKSDSFGFYNDKPVAVDYGS